MSNNLKKHQQYNFFQNIFARFWAAWGLIWFIISFLIFFFPSMLAYAFKDEKRGQYFFILMSRWWMRVWLGLIACPVRIKGQHHFAKGATYVVVFNHNALLDVPLSAPFVPGANKTIAKASFAKVPLFGLFYRRGAVLVNRTNDKSRIKSYEDMKATLHKKIHMCIYPEGTRNRTDAPLKTFYDGAFKLAVDTQTAIIPCIIKGTTRAMPIHKSFFLLPTLLKMEFLAPVSPHGKTAKGLKQEVFDLMLKKFTETPS